MTYIEFKDVCKKYQMGKIEINAIDNTTFKINKGELVVIVSLLGTGKTI